jgi:hypothetical protein
MTKCSRDAPRRNSSPGAPRQKAVRKLPVKNCALFNLELHLSGLYDYSPALCQQVPEPSEQLADVGNVRNHVNQRDHIEAPLGTKIFNWRFNNLASRRLSSELRSLAVQLNSHPLQFVVHG